MAKGKAVAIGPVSNGAEETIDASRPYYMDVTIEGIVPLLMHRYSVEAVDAKNKAAKGSAAKKSDDLESFVYRDEAGELCIPGVAIRGAIVTAAKFEQDPAKYEGKLAPAKDAPLPDEPAKEEKKDGGK